MRMVLRVKSILEFREKKSAIIYSNTLICKASNY